MKTVVIIGGGFAGLAAAARLRRAGDGVEVILIDRRPTHQFLPLLPDLVGRDLDPSLLCYPLARAAAQTRCRLVQATVHAVDIAARRVLTDGDAIAFDYLLLASGVESDFYGQTQVRERACEFRAAEDAARLRARLPAGQAATVVVAGGGYTGVEVATHVVRAGRRAGLRHRVVLVDPAPAICNALPDPFRRYIAANLLAMGIETRLGTTVADATHDSVTLAGGETFAPAALVWTAGVRTADFLHALPGSKTRQGRLEADPNLQFADACFAAGDVCAVVRGGQPLRMGVQAAISQGACAGDNIRRAIAGKPLRPYRPWDPGYLVPMANGRACGRVLGVPVYGRVATWLHYAMCLVRLRGTGCRATVLRVLLAGTPRR